MKGLSLAPPQEARVPGDHVPLHEIARDTTVAPDAAATLGDHHSAPDETPPRRRRIPSFLLVVLLPTLLVAAFEYLVASDQYVSEAHFIVRGSQSGPNASGLSQLLGLGGGPAPSDAHSVGDYLMSHDAVAAIGRGLNLVEIFRRPEADPMTRLWEAQPEPETLLRYYRRQVEVSYNSETGITNLSVRAFRPGDAKALADALLRVGEAQVNSLNARMLQDGLSAAARQVRATEAQVSDAQAGLTAFRQSRRDIDPERTSTAQIGVAAQLEAQASQARAQLQAMRGAISPSAPQYVAMSRAARALETQAVGARARLAGPDASTAKSLGTYEELRLRQEFAAKQYEAAATSLAAAREQLLRQQLFVVRVVEPNLPGKALYPKRFKIVATVLVGLLLVYAIGWLILAGVREHAA